VKIVEFRFENYRSFNSEQVLSLQTSKFRTPHPKAVLLPAIGIFGQNAGGKTNVIHAFSYMLGCLNNREIPFRDGFEPRAKNTEPKDSIFILTFMLDGVMYEYGFVLSGLSHRTCDEVIEEWLWTWPKGRKRTIFFRDKCFVGGKGMKKFAACVKNKKLILTMGALMGHPILEKIWDSLTKLLGPVVESSSYDFLLRVLQIVDCSITDVDMKTKYVIRDNIGTSVNTDSRSVKLLWQFAMTLWPRLQTGDPVFIDDFGDELHPNSVIKLLELLTHPDVNPHEAQIIFTSRCIQLFDVLQRDQIWLVEKDGLGSDLYPLSNYKSCKNEDVAKMYLEGRYGAIP